jgi:hypothetical protein
VLLPILLVMAVVAVACSEESAPGKVLQDLDFEQLEGGEVVVDRNNILETAAFIDIDSIDVKQVERFLSKTPYDRPSFLETYQSNGVRAADAIMRASRKHRINPLVFLVFAQTTQGLVGERNYPFPPWRVEYVFGCGCFQGGNCAPELAGFDRQVDCLGRSLRDALDAIAAEKATLSGWGPEITSTALDGPKVTPANEGTAVIYDRRPFVNEGEPGGSWIYWNVWNLYALGVDYIGPIGGAPIDGWIGDPCVSDASCGYENATCALDYPQGLCSLECDGSCPANPDRPESYCVGFPEGGFCFQVCNPASPACRDNYKCLRLARYQGTGPDDSQYVCYPAEVP